jgi:hypothetical protein
MEKDATIFTYQVVALMGGKELSAEGSVIIHSNGIYYHSIVASFFVRRKEWPERDEIMPFKARQLEALKQSIDSAMSLV